jgi:TPR repeat protein
MRIAQYYREGYGLKKNLPLAFEFMQRAADKNNARAQYELAQMFRDGVGTEVNDDAASYWLEKAVENGEPEAMLSLGKMCLESSAVLDSVRGGELLRGASLKDNAEALYRYAIYMFAVGQESDSLLGTPDACIERSAELGGGDALVYLMNKADARGDYKEAYKIAHKLHLKKNHHGTKYVADCLRAGRAVRRNKRLATDLYRDAARAGNSESERILKER